MLYHSKGECSVDNETHTYFTQNKKTTLIEEKRSLFLCYPAPQIEQHNFENGQHSLLWGGEHTTLAGGHRKDFRGRTVADSGSCFVFSTNPL